MILERTRDPGLGALVFHILAVSALALLVVAVWPFRVGVGLLAEGLIRASDGLADALQERLDL